MANKIVNAVKKIKLGDSNAKSIFRELADCANSDGFCFPSYSTIAEVLEVSPKSIQRGMNFLISNGWVIRGEKEKINGKFVGFTFQINLNFLGISDLEFLVDKPMDNLTNGQSDQWTICPTETALPVDKLSKKEPLPVDNLTNGQFVHHNLNKKDLSLNPQIKEFNQEKEREKHPPARELSVDEVLELDEIISKRESTYLEKDVVQTKAIEIYQSFFPTNFLNERQISSFAERLPDADFDETLWIQTVKDWFDVGHRSSNFVGMIDKYYKNLQFSKTVVGATAKPLKKFLW